MSTAFFPRIAQRVAGLGCTDSDIRVQVPVRVQYPASRLDSRGSKTHQLAVQADELADRGVVAVTVKPVRGGDQRVRRGGCEAIAQRRDQRRRTQLGDDPLAVAALAGLAVGAGRIDHMGTFAKRRALSYVAAAVGAKSTVAQPLR